MTLISLGQTSYPIVQVIDGDTVIVITHAQLKFANRESAKVVHLTKRIYTYEVVITTLEQSLALQKMIADENEKKMKNYMIGADSYLSIIEEKNTTIQDNIKAARKQKRKAVLTSTIVGVIAGLVLSIFI